MKMCFNFANSAYTDKDYYYYYRMYSGLHCMPKYKFAGLQNKTRSSVKLSFLIQLNFYKSNYPLILNKCVCL